MSKTYEGHVHLIHSHRVCVAAHVFQCSGPDKPPLVIVLLSARYIFQIMRCLRGDELLLNGNIYDLVDAGLETSTVTLQRLHPHSRDQGMHLENEHHTCIEHHARSSRGRQAGRQASRQG